MKYFVTIAIEYADLSIDVYAYDHVSAPDASEAIISAIRRFNKEASEDVYEDYEISKVTCERMSNLL